MEDNHKPITISASSIGGLGGNSGLYLVIDDERKVNS